MYQCFHCLYHSLKVFFEEKQYFFADLPPNSAFPNLTLDARSSANVHQYCRTAAYNKSSCASLRPNRMLQTCSHNLGRAMIVFTSKPCPKLMYVQLACL